MPGRYFSQSKEALITESLFLLFILIFVSAGATLGTKASLFGSYESLRKQNIMADNDNLIRIEDDRHLKELIEAKLLVPLPQNKYIQIDPRLPKKFRYCLLWTKEYLDDFGAKHYEKFKKPLWINAAVRTLVYQGWLDLINPNAASVYGDTASVHPTGSTIDIGKKSMSRRELLWMRAYLLDNEQSGLIEATEEFHQLVFHVMVFKK